MSTSTPTPARRLTATARAARNAQIASSREKDGATWIELGRRFGLSPKQASRAAREHLRSSEAARTLEDVDGVALMRQVIDAHTAALRTAVAMLTEGDNSSARTGAANAVARVSASLHRLLVAVGAFGDPALQRYATEVNAAARVLIAFADAHQVSDEEVEAALARFPVPPGLVREAA